MAPQPTAEPTDHDALRAAIVAAGRRLRTRGLISAAEGNLSVRLADGALLITPTGLRKDELEDADLVAVPIHEEAVSGAPLMDQVTDGPAARRPSSDVAIHRAIYEARADAQAIVHAHLPASMALTLAGEVPDPAVLPETALLLPRLPFVPFAAMGSVELAAAVAAALLAGAEPLPGAVLLERHGAVAVGQTVDEAVDRLELVEVLCRAWADALLIRGAVTRAGERAILRGPRHRPGAQAGGSSRRHR